jgi:hypothetical protein
MVLLPLLALWARRGAASGRPWWRRPGTVGLLVLACLSTASYARQGHRTHKSTVLGYDVYHYYMGGKYRAEVGTERIYDCALVADLERKRPRFKKLRRVRDLRTYKVRSIKSHMRRGVSCREHFSDARWKEFKRDLHYFQRFIKRKTWDRMFIDRGTNASPVWHLFGGAVARLVPTKHLIWATHIDALLLLIMLGFVGWAFGLDVACVGLVFLTACFSTRWPHIGRALFRYDWLAATGIGVCLIHKKRPATAGVAFAYAAGVRLFPVVILAGIAARGVRQLIAQRRLERPEARILTGFLVSMAILIGAAAADGGPASLGEFTQKIGTHAAPENVSVMRVGLSIAAAYRGEWTRKETKGHRYLIKKRKMIKQSDRVLKLIAIALFLLVVWIAPPLADLELLLLGFALLPLGLQASYYYYVIALVPLLIHAHRLDRRAHFAGLAFLSWLNAVGLFAQARHTHRYVILAPGSIIMCTYALVLIGVLWSVGKRRRPSPAPSILDPKPVEELSLDPAIATDLDDDLP